jgi:hypothetical protein
VDKLLFELFKRFELENVGWGEGADVGGDLGLGRFGRVP